MPRPRAIPTSRLLVGILLHFCLPAYLLACLATAFLLAPVVAGWSELPERMLWTAALFVPAFLLVTAAAAGAGALLDHRRPPVIDPAATLRESLMEARRLFSTMPHPGLGTALARLDAVRWDDGNRVMQKVAEDLLIAARTFAVAHESATLVGRAAVLDLAVDSVERLTAAATDAADERRRLDEGDAQTVAGYLAARYSDGDTAPLH